jgi:multidrug transporter EmrE-like cation transporter
MTAYWAALVAAIAASMAGQVMLKAGAVAEGGFLAQLFRPITIIGLGVYGGAALLYIVALRKIPMSVALPCTAASYVVAALIGYQFFGEPLGAQKLLALALICGGVVLLASA